MLGAATASLKTSIPIFVIVWAAGHPVCCLPPSGWPLPSPAFSLGNMPFAALSWVVVRTLCTRMRDLVYVPSFVCLCWWSGEQERWQAVQPLEYVCPPGAGSVHAVFTSLQRAARTEMLPSNQLATLGGGRDVVEITWSRSCPA